MKKIAVIAFGMLLFILPTKAQTLESQYGLDSANTILNAGNRKITKKRCPLGGTFS